MPVVQTWFTHHPPATTHRHLKSANIWLEDSFDTKIFDFCLVRLRELGMPWDRQCWDGPVTSTMLRNADILCHALHREEMTGKCPCEGLSAVQVIENLARRGLELFSHRIAQLASVGWLNNDLGQAFDSEAYKKNNVNRLLVKINLNYFIKQS